MSLDLSRLTKLQTILGDSVPEIVAGLRDSLLQGIERIESGVAGHDLDDACRAAHLCRNDALLLGAEQLLRALQEVEHACRSGRLEAARTALDQLRLVWPATLEQLESVARTK